MVRPTELWIGAGLIACSLLPGYFTTDLSDSFAGPIYFITALVVLLPLLCIVTIASGTARGFLAAIMTIAVVLMLVSPVVMLANPIILGVTVAQVAGMVMLYLPPVSGWIRNIEKELT